MMPSYFTCNILKKVVKTLSVNEVHPPYVATHVVGGDITTWGDTKK
jgi:hypothetical protein